mgnify:CR=1 FL=1|jgi:hypothetical protein
MGFLFSIFVLMYLCFYTILVITAFLKFSVKKKLCTFTNFKIYILSYFLLYPLQNRVNTMQEKRLNMEALLVPNSITCADPTSPLATLNKLYSDAYNLVCSKDCPCSGNPMLYKDDPRVQIVDTSSPVDCVDSSNVRCLYFNYKDNSYNAQKCYSRQQ